VTTLRELRTQLSRAAWIEDEARDIVRAWNNKDITHLCISIGKLEHIFSEDEASVHIANPPRDPTKPQTHP
jgi:fructose-1-phosphate kinase PfkB-like protein